MSRPLLITDCDEVLLHMVSHFADWVSETRGLSFNLTASAVREFPATGIRDQLHGRDYGDGFWRQQWLGLKRLSGRA
jgi:hypothetical protein